MLALGAGSRALKARAEQEPCLTAAATAAVGGSLSPVPGGVLVRDPARTLLDAVGLSGATSHADEAAVAGIETGGVPAQPD